jgi:cell division protein FtsQ
MSSIVLAGGAVGRREQTRSKPKASRFFIIAIIILSVVLVFELVFHLLVAPKMLVRNIQITSDSLLSLDDTSLLAIAELDKSIYYFDLETDAIATRLESYPLIKQARVEKAFPDTLKIYVTGRRPLGIALAAAETTGEGRFTPVAFDDDGVIFQIGSSIENFDLPIISGLTFANVRLGQRIARPLTGFLSDLQRLRSAESELFNLISEVKFVKKNQTSFEVVLFLKDYPVRVLLGTTLDADLMKRIVLVLDVFSRKGFDDIREIDFRTEEIVMRVKGE